VLITGDITPLAVAASIGSVEAVDLLMEDRAYPAKPTVKLRIYGIIT
jgi:hypothetical protein